MDIVGCSPIYCSEWGDLPSINDLWRRRMGKVPKTVPIAQLDIMGSVLCIAQLDMMGTRCFTHPTSLGLYRRSFNCRILLKHALTDHLTLDEF